MASRNGNKRILVVDDEWLIAALLEDMVHELGHDVVGPAPNVVQALQLIADDAPDAAVLDVSLDGARSYPIADALAERGIPFVFLTGFATSDLPTAYGNRPILSKPIGLDMLRVSLSELLAS